MNVLKTLRAKLFYVMIISATIAVLPCWKVQSGFSNRIKKSAMQQKAVELLNAVAVFSNNIYAKENKLVSYDKVSMSEAIEFLAGYYEVYATNNLKIKTLFSKNALNAFQQKKIRESVVAEMASTITDRASLFSDSRAGIRILMEVSGSTMPSIMSDVMAFSKVAKKNITDSKTLSNSAISLFSRFSNQTRSMVFRLGNASNSTDFKVAPEIFEKTNRLNSSLTRIDRIIVQFQQGTATKEQLFESVDSFESILFDIWSSANKNLLSMLSVKSEVIKEEMFYFWGILSGIIILVVISCFLISRSIVVGIFRISKILKLASNGNIGGAREAYEETVSKNTEYNELNENVLALINYMSDLIDISKNIANVSNKVNLMLSSINATKTPLLISIKDAFSEANKQIHSDYELIQQEAIKLGECASMITEIERNLKSARKIGAVIRENVVSVFSFSGAIFNRLSECKSMLDKISSTTDTLRDSAEKINLLGLNLSIIAQKMGGNSAGADTLASQIRLVSRQIAVATVDIDTVATTLSKFISESQSDNAKIGEISEASKNATGQIDSLSGNSWSDVSNVGSQMLAVATSLRSNVSSSFDSDSTIQDIDDIKDSIKDMASIVKKAGENVEVLRSRIK